MRSFCAFARFLCMLKTQNLIDPCHSDVARRSECDAFPHSDTDRLDRNLPPPAKRKGGGWGVGPFMETRFCAFARLLCMSITQNLIDPCHSDVATRSECDAFPHSNADRLDRNLPPPAKRKGGGWGVGSFKETRFRASPQGKPKDMPSRGGGSVSEANGGEGLYSSKLIGRRTN